MKPEKILRTLLACLLGISISCNANAEKLVIYADEVYAPVIYSNQGRPAGIIPTILERLSRDTGDTYELRLVPWKRALEESSRGSGGITGFSWNKERAAVYDFSIPIYDDDIQLVVLKGKEFPYKDFHDLKGITLGGAAGASYGEDLDQTIKNGLITVERDREQSARLKKLLLGRIDAAIIGNGKAGFELILNSDPELAANRAKFVVLEQTLVHDPLHLAFPKSMHMQPALARFNSALKRLKASEEYERILLRQD